MEGKKASANPRLYRSSNTIITLCNTNSRGVICELQLMWFMEHYTFMTYEENAEKRRFLQAGHKPFESVSSFINQLLFTTASLSAHGN
jgi:hypothetical protein